MINLVQANLNASGPFGWFSFERRNWIASVGLAFVFGFGLGNGHTTQTAIQEVSQQLDQKAAQLHRVQTVDLPKLRAANHCEAIRGDRAAALAQQAIKGAVMESERIPDAREVPVDNCPHPAGK